MQLKTTGQTDVKGEIDGNVVSTSLSQGQIISLAMKQYADPYYSAITETISNALDSHHAAGCYSRPIEISIDEQGTKQLVEFRIRDFGSGMSEEFLTKNLFSLGYSSKRDDPRQTGFWGLGFKALLVISPVVQVTTYDGTTAMSVVGQLNEASEIKVSDVVKEPSEQERGTEVTFFVSMETSALVTTDSYGKHYPNTKVIDVLAGLMFIGFSEGVDNTPKLAVTSDVEQSKKMIYDSNSVIQLFTKSKSALKISRALSEFSIRSPGVFICSDKSLQKVNSIQRYLYEKLINEFATKAVLWQDKIYRLPDSMQSAVSELVDTYISTYSSTDLLFDVPYTVKFEISSDRATIRDTVENRNLLLNHIKTSLDVVVARGKTLHKEAATEITQCSFGLWSEARLDTLNRHVQMSENWGVLKLWSALNPFGSVMRALRAFDARHCVRSRYGSVEVTKVNYGGEGKSTQLGAGTDFAPVVLVVPHRKPQLVRTYLSAIDECEYPATFFTVVLPSAEDLDDVSKTQEQFFDDIVQALPPWVSVVDVVKDAEVRNISLKVKRDNASLPDSGDDVGMQKYIKKHTGKWVLTGQNWSSANYATVAVKFDEKEFERVSHGNNLSKTRVAVAPISGFRIIDGYLSGIGTDNLYTVKKVMELFDLQTHFYRQKVDLDEYFGDTEVSHVDVRELLHDFFVKNYLHAKRIRIKSGLTELQEQIVKLRDRLKEKLGMTLEQLLKDHANFDYSSSKIARLEQMQLPDWRPTDAGYRLYYSVLHFRDQHMFNNRSLHRRATNESLTALWNMIGYAVCEIGCESERRQYRKLQQKFDGNVANKWLRSYASVLGVRNRLFSVFSDANTIIANMQDHVESEFEGKLVRLNKQRRIRLSKLATLFMW